MKPKLTTKTCSKCKATFEVWDDDDCDSGAAWGRPDLCWDCAETIAMNKGCTHPLDDCTCAIEEEA
jgi:hypothetical protein